MLLGDGRSCAGLERGPIFGNATRVRARLRPQLVSSLGRPILSRSQGASRITRQSCPIGYTSRDGACVGRFFCTVGPSSPVPPADEIFSFTLSRCPQTWTSVCSGGPASTSAGTQWAASSVSVLQVTSSYPTAGAAKVRHWFEMTSRSRLNVLCLYLFMLIFMLWFADIDECVEQGVQCGHNQMCFNTRGGYQCMDTPCPASYQRGGSPG